MKHGIPQSVFLLVLALLVTAGNAARGEGQDYPRLMTEGHEAFRAQDYAKAAVVFERANALADGESKECLAVLGLAYTKLEQPVRAVAAYEKLHEITGGVLYQHLRPLTEAYRRAGRPDRAVEACRAMIRRTQQTAVLVRTYNELGYWLLFAPEDTTSLEAAEAAFAKALELSDGHAEAARLNLAEVLHRRRRSGEIAELLTLLDNPKKAKSWRDLRRIEISEAISQQATAGKERARLDAKNRAAEIQASGEPLQVGGDVKRPEKIRAPQAQITAEARNSGVNGTVILQTVIDVEGNVGQVKVLQGLPHGLTETSIAAVKRWKFKPATLDGEPVPVYYNLTMNFRIPARRSRN